MFKEKLLLIVAFSVLLHATETSEKRDICRALVMSGGANKGSY